MDTRINAPSDQRPRAQSKCFLAILRVFDARHHTLKRWMTGHAKELQALLLSQMGGDQQGTPPLKGI